MSQEELDDEVFGVHRHQVNLQWAKIEKKSAIEGSRTI